MASSLKVDVSIMPDFPTPPPHSDASSTTSSPSSSSSTSSTTSSKARSTVVEATPPPAAASASCPYGPDYDQHGHKIKRPMNAFMVWAQMRRAEITAVSSKVHNSTISKALGIEWREMTEAAKQPYVQKAKELRDELFRDHPHYVYRPRKRKVRAAPYSPRPASGAAPGTMNTQTACLPAGSATSLLLSGSGSLPAPPATAASCSSSNNSSCASPPSPSHSFLATAAMLQQHHQQAAEQQQQMPFLLHPGLLAQLQQHSAALTAAMQQQQQPQPPPSPAAMMNMNPLLLANLLNPLLAQMLFAASASSAQ